MRTRSSAVASMPAVSEFVFDGWEEIEEHVKAASASPFALARRYVHGRSLDEPVRLENLSFYPGPGTYWFQQSTLGNVAALADSTGAIVERYSYDAYGLPQFETPANQPKAVTESDFGNPYLFHARRFEPALYPLYDFRARFLDPTRGRFVQRDPPGTWHDKLNLGNQLCMVWNDPVNIVDPLGLHGDPRAAFERLRGAINSALEWTEECANDVRDIFDQAQEYLGYAGLIPGVGAGPDVVNSGIYLLRGDLDNAKESMLFAIPFVGDIKSINKLSRVLSRLKGAKLEEARRAAKRLHDRLKQQVDHDKKLKDMKDSLSNKKSEMSHETRKQLEKDIRELEESVQGHHKAIEQAQNQLEKAVGRENATEIRSELSKAVGG